MSSTLKIFICYARLDNEAPNHWLDRVKEHLETIHDSELVAVDSDEEISPGQLWHEYIQGKLGEIGLAILLISPSFLASKYVKEHELPKVLQRFHEQGLRIFPVFVRPVAEAALRVRYRDGAGQLQPFNLGALQAFATPKRTLADMAQAEWDRELARLVDAVWAISETPVQSPFVEMPPLPAILVTPTQPHHVPVPLEPKPPLIELKDGIPRPIWASAFDQDQYGVWAEFQVKGVVQRCRWIKPGEFWMGSPREEADRKDNETLHEVTLTRGYWLADTACTQALWKAVMGDNPSHFKGDPRLPVDSVSWKDCDAFCQRLNTKVPGLGAGFPTEAQWEYACRAGTTTPFSFGETVTPDQVNYDGNYPYGGSKKGQYREKTVGVGSLPPNPWGLYEMHGNLWEWCGDLYAPYRGDPQTDPEGPASGGAEAARVLRGGSWRNYGGWCRAAYRFRYAPDGRIQGFGFRLAPRSS